MRSTMELGKLTFSSIQPARGVPGGRQRGAELLHQAGQHGPVVVKVVAAQDGDRPGVGTAAALQPADQPTDRGARLGGAAEIGRNLRVGEVQPAAAGGR